MRKLLKSNAKGLKSYGGGASHFFFALLMLLTLGSGNAWAGNREDFNYRLQVKAIFGNGSPASSYVTVYGHYGAPSPTPTPSSNDYTMPSSSNSEWNGCPDLNLAGTAMNGEEFVGWYLDKACTQLLCSTLTGEIWSTSTAPGIGDIDHYTTAAEAETHIQTIYALFTAPPMDWSPYAEAPIAKGKYYIYNVGNRRLVGLETVSDGKLLHCYKDPNQAVLFTLSDATNPMISCEDEGETKCVDKNGYIKTSGATNKTLSPQGDGSYKIHLNNGNSAGYVWCEAKDNGRTTNATSSESTMQRWMFIPEAKYKLLWKVKSVNENGTVTINASPTASGTTYVKFNVSGVGPIDAFDYELTGNDGHWEVGSPTLADSIFTVPVTYTAYNIHSGTSAYISQATVTLTAKNTAATHASGTVTAYVNLQPTFTMAVDELDWSAKQGGDEIYNVGMEVAASQRERLQNKLVYNTANAIAQNNATWTATITGTNADQFKFANGTRTVSGLYSADLLDVIYAPTASSGEGSHSATLHIEASYTDASATPQTLTCVREVVLSGKAQNVPMLTMALNGSETASNSENLDFGNIVGTISKTVTVDLYNHGLTNLTKAWVTTTDGVFEFDADTIDLTKANQRLVIHAHRSTPITTEYEDYEATLTISGEDANHVQMSAVLTLNYRALPLVNTSVTWNWELLNEDATYTNPITTNSDGEWTLVQRDGNGGMTYDAETKSITTEYMHHESGYQAKFELIIPQTDSCTAYRDTTLEATINAFVPEAIYINSQANYDEYVVAPTDKNHLTYNSTTNALSGTLEPTYFQWSGQSTVMFEYDGPSYSRLITEEYSDGTTREVYNGAFSNTETNIFSISPQTNKLIIKISNTILNVRYFEYDTIDVNYHGVVFVEGGATTRDIIATFANKRAVTISLNAAAQPYFELRAEGKPTGSSLVYDNADGLAVHKFVKGKKFTVAIKDGVNYAEAKAAAVNGFQVILQDNYTYNSETVILPIALEEAYKVTYKHDANGSYKVTYHDDMEHPQTVSAADYEHTVTSVVETSCTATLSEPTPASGYMFRGWKVNGELVSCKATYTVIPGNGATVEPVFVLEEDTIYMIDDAAFADLDVALSTAGSIADTKPVVVLQKDVTLSEPATHTIPAGVTLLIPYKANFKELQYTPEITTTAKPLAAYRTLTLKEGVNLVVNGNICVSAKIMAAGGGNKSAYTTDECGVINMANGGHITLNNGAHLYCWGYIKGQDMDQGNNTVGTGTITVNAGAVVHENFELGDWRGGTASSNIYFEKDDKHLFPFQSYALQNIEIPTTYTFGSKLETFMVVNTGFGSVPFAVSMIGSANTLFLLKDEGSVIRKWYDPTTDLCCYELSGTAQLDELTINLPFVGEFKSGDCNLPVSNSMHILLKDNLTLSKRLMVQAGAVLEIKNTATIDLEAPVYLYDKDEWGKHIHDFYFRSFNNLTSHKNRGNEKSKEGLEDAKFIIDGTLNVKADKGYIYSTAGGANLMGNGGGQIVFEGTLPDPSILWAVDTIKGAPYIKWVNYTVKAANLCNEDGSYTQSLEGETFRNIHGRWFREADDEYLPQEDHTYVFRYLSNGNAGEEVVASAVYSHDKTGLEARMKWFNVTPDADCPTSEPEEDLTSDWWKDASNRYYNYTKLGEWHQFIKTENTEYDQYSGSNNVLYRKTDCNWTEDAYIDENCLYTIGGVKKALVGGEFIPLTANGYDPAYHASGVTPEQYYICFTGCNWHPATPYTGESKAYTINPETGVYMHYIWFNNDWMNVERDGAFFYTADEQTNVRTYYEYVNGEWEVATPYVSVSDAAETRTFYMIKEAFNVASIKKDATITLLRDISNVSEVLTYTTQNTTCTLDLNGHLLAGEIDSLIYVNAPGATFIITDNTTLKLGKIRTTKTRAIFVKAGTVEVNNGTIEATVASGAAYAIYGAAAATININGGYFLAQGNSSSKCVHAAGTYAITGGYYNINTGLANYTVDAYPFANDDPVYKWVVEAAWTIIFKNGETTLQTLHLHQGEMPVYTAAFPTLDNHQFTGWNPAVAAATANVTYQAQFAELEGEEKCVTFNANGGNATLPYKYVTSGSAVGELPTATKAGHTFTGWFTEASAGTEVTSSTTVSANVTYYAHYTKNSYTLTWDANGATITSADDAYTHGSVEYGTTIIAPAVSKDGWTFEGWNVTPATTMPAANTTYTAQWTIPYTVQHKQQNLNDAGYTVFETDNFTAKSGEYVTPAVNTYDGFISPAAQTVQIGAVTEVTYNYTRRTYAITLDANGGTCATTSMNVKHGATLSLPVATKNGANCTGWFTKAIGGDQITNETEILYNIGTLYAQYADLNVTAPLTVSDDRDVSDLRVTTTGSLNVTGSINATNFYLESNGSTASGQIVGGNANIHATNIYFDYKINAKNHKWYSVAVPWLVDATSGISVNGRVLQLGKDFDILYYNGATRASAGVNGTAWSYIEDDIDNNIPDAQYLQPGKLYMIGLMMDAPTIRFQKKDGASLLTTTTSVTAHSGGAAAADQGWNGIANPALFHAFVNTGVTAGQVYNPETNGYDPILMNGAKFVVGKSAFVQVSSDKSITVAYGGAYAPRRTRAEEATLYDVQIAPENADYTDRLFVRVEEDKADQYIIGQDLAKMGVSSVVPQLWINRYDAKLCMNTQSLTNGIAEYPLSIYAPANGEYVISCQPSAVSDQNALYLTLDGQAIWNLTDAAYTLTLSKGTATNYGLRISARAPQTATGTDEAIIDAKGETKKVLINDKVYIIREGQIYSVDGRLVK